MLRFGKYKGKDLQQIVNFDCQYIIWLINNVTNIKLDKKDSEFINKFTNPITYLYNKYGNITNKKEDNVLQILKNEGLVHSASQYIGNDGALHYEIKTIYASIFGSMSELYPFVTSNHINLASEALELIKVHSRKLFKK